MFSSLVRLDGCAGSEQVDCWHGDPLPQGEEQEELPPSLHFVVVYFLFYFVLFYFIFFTCYGSLSRSTALSFLTASDEAHLVHFYSLVFCFNVCYYPEARMSTLLSNGIGISYCLVVRNSRLINVEKLDCERTDLIVVLFLQLHRWR